MVEKLTKLFSVLITLVWKFCHAASGIFQLYIYSKVVGKTLSFVANKWTHTMDTLIDMLWMGRLLFAMAGKLWVRKTPICATHKGLRKKLTVSCTIQNVRVTRTPMTHAPWSNVKLCEGGQSLWSRDVSFMTNPTCISVTSRLFPLTRVSVPAGGTRFGSFAVQPLLLWPPWTC